MRADLHNNKDFLAGLLFIAFGGAAVYFARDYPMGWIERMGPGYFPTVLGWVLCLFGASVMLRGLITGEAVKGAWGWRPLGFLTFAIVVFGATMETIGLVPSLIMLIFVAALAGRDFRLKEVVLLAILMSAFTAGVFIYGLNLPYPMFGAYH
jgi:hypothetical protein